MIIWNEETEKNYCIRLVEKGEYRYSDTRANEDNSFRNHIR